MPYNTKQDYFIGQMIMVKLRYSSPTIEPIRAIVVRFHPETKSRYLHYEVKLDNGLIETVLTEEIVRPLDITEEFKAKQC